MSRRKAATKREILPDSKYNNLVVAKCINVVYNTYLNVKNFFGGKNARLFSQSCHR